MTTKKTAAVSALIGAFKEFEDEVKARAWGPFLQH
jgi:hypothetical protein